MKTAIFSIVICLVVLGMFVFRKTLPPSPSTSTPLVLGALLPLTGNGSDQAEWIQQGFELALREINQDHERVVIRYEDTKGDTNSAISAYMKLKTQEKIPVVFSWGSGIGLALSPLANQDHIVQMGIATASPKYTSPHDYTFRNFPSASEEAKYIANQVNSIFSQSKIALVKINNDYGQGQAEVFKKEISDLGSTITLEETLEPKVVDFRSVVSKLQNTPTDIIFLATYPTEGAIFIKQLREQGVTTPIIASNAILGGAEFFTTTGAKAEGLIVSNSTPVFTDSEDLAVKDFTSKYEEAFGTSPGALQSYTARAYDALKMVMLTIDACNEPSSSCIQKELANIKNFHGASGTTSFDINGDIQTVFNLQVLKEGKFIPYK